MEKLDIFCPHCGERLIYSYDKRRKLPHVVKCKDKCMIVATTSKDESINDAQLNSRLPVICTDGSTIPPHEPIKQEVVMNIQVLDKLFKAADDLNDDMIYEGFCHKLVPNTDGLLCHKCSFYINSKEGCMLNNALSMLDYAKSVYKTLKK